MKHKRIVIVVVVAVLAAVLIGGATLAQTSGEIAACIDEAGKVAGIGFAENITCDPKRTRITWSIAGPQGPAGPTGPEGPAGPEGLPGVLDFYTAYDSFDIPAQTLVSGNAYCEDGDAAMGGTWNLSCPHCVTADTFRYEGGAIWWQGGGTKPVGWQVRIKNENEYFPMTVNVYVTCADITP